MNLNKKKKKKPFEHTREQLNISGIEVLLEMANVLLWHKVNL